MERSQNMIAIDLPGKGAIIAKIIFGAKKTGTSAIMTSGTCVRETERPVIMDMVTDHIPDKESLINNWCLV